MSDSSLATLRLSVRGEVVTAIAADGRSLVVRTGVRLLPGRQVTIRVDDQPAVARVLTCRVDAVTDAGIAYVVRLETDAHVSATLRTA
jgi:hypothetical protein